MVVTTVFCTIKYDIEGKMALNLEINGFGYRLLSETWDTRMVRCSRATSRGTSYFF